MSLLQADARQLPLAAESVQCVVTSPPYWDQRDYNVEAQIGLEDTYLTYVDAIVQAFREVHRVLRPDGTLWLNLGDKFAGSWGAQSREHAGKHAPNVSALSANQVRAAAIRSAQTGSLSRTPGRKRKELIGLPWLVAFALQADGWYLRRDIIWAKGVSFCPDYVGSVMPENVGDRPSTSHEYLFLLTKSTRYMYDADAVAEPGVYPAGTRAAKGSGTRQGNRRKAEYATYSGTRNLRSVWVVPTRPSRHEHFATFPPDLVRPCVLAGSRLGDMVLDPFCGVGTTGEVAEQHGRRFVGCDLNRSYLQLAQQRQVEAA